MKRHQKGFVLIWLIVLAVVAAVAAGGILYLSRSSLNGVPVAVGGMAFNERNNDGFDESQVIGWSTNDLQVSSRGKASGTFDMRYDGPPVPYSVFRDVLFVQAQADYSGSFGDIAHIQLSDVLPVISEQSAERSTKFFVVLPFQRPQPVTNWGSLQTVWINLTWVRVYRNGDSYYFHIFPGLAGTYYKDVTRFSFDQDPKPIMGRLGYYAVRPHDGLGGGDFGYREWLGQTLFGDPTRLIPSPPLCMTDEGAKTLPDKTYTDNTRGFSFRYPGAYEIVRGEPEDLNKWFSYLTCGSRAHSFSVRFRYEQLGIKQSLGEFLSTIGGSFGASDNETRNIEVDGRSAIIVKIRDGFTSIFIATGKERGFDNVVEINQQSRYTAKEDMDLILSTFRFSFPKKR